MFEVAELLYQPLGRLVSWGYFFSIKCRNGGCSGLGVIELSGWQGGCFNCNKRAHQEDNCAPLARLGADSIPWDLGRFVKLYAQKKLSKIKQTGI